MPPLSCPNEEFIRLFEEFGAAETARKLGVSIRCVFNRRATLEAKTGIKINSPNHEKKTVRFETDYPQRIPFEIKNGIAIIGSDCHYYPGITSPAHRAYVKLCNEFGSEVKLVCLNGDVFDLPKASKHKPIGWTRKPSVNEEKECVDERTEEIYQVSKKAKHVWTLGNHCWRFENYLADHASAFENIHGFRLRDHFPAWKFCVSMWVNNDVVVKHRFKGGVHATHNNTLHAGKTMVTGHLHSLKVTPFDDYNGTRYGVDTGTLADPYGPHADYVEDNPLNHRSGFIVATFHNGKLLWPEVVAVVDENHVQFRGQILKV